MDKEFVREVLKSPVDDEFKVELLELAEHLEHSEVQKHMEQIKERLERLRWRYGGL
jgi:hypothetical protein